MKPRSALAWAILVCAISTAGPLQTAAAQESDRPGEISGVVKDTTGAVIPGAQIAIKNSELSTASDNTGHFLLKGIALGDVTLIASLPGFTQKETTVHIQAGTNPKIEIVLDLESREYSVVVELETPKLMSASESIGVVTVSPAQMAALPSLGEKDIFRSLQLMPGVSASNEASAGLYVRGGTPDQNLVLFDGFTVYKVDHFFGIFSAFNATAVDSVSMFKGGFESKFGGRTSSVVDLIGRSGNKNEIEVGGGLSLLSYNAYADGPLGKKGTFMLAGRRSYQSPLSDRVRNNYSNTSGPGGPGGGPFQVSSQPQSSFYDLNGRATYALSSKDTLILSLYYGMDDFDNSRSLNLPSFGADQNRTLSGDITDLSHWGNGGASLNWQRNWTQSFTTSLTAAVSHYFKNSHRSSDISSRLSTSDTDESFTDDSYENNRVNDQTLRWANSLIPSRSHYVEFGAEIIRNEIKYDYIFNEDLGKTVRQGESLQEAFYLQDRYKPFSKFEITPGVRAVRYSLTREFFLEPRVSIIFHATDRLRLKAAAGRYHQFVRDLVRENPLQGDQDFWTLADGVTVPVSSADHFIAGASYESDRFLFDVEGYRKNLRNLTEFGALRPPPRDPTGNPRPPSAVDFNTLFFTGSGKAEGVEFLAQKKVGNHQGWLTYTLGRVLYDFPGLSDTPYPASHDSTHEFKVIDTFRWKFLTVSGSWVFATGKPITAPVGYEDVVFTSGRTFSRPIFGSKNGERLPDYHRLDLSTWWDFYKGEDNRAKLGVSVFNAYNRANVWRREYRFFDADKLTTDVNYLGLTVSAFVNVDLTVPSSDRKAGPAWTQQTKKDDYPKRPRSPFKTYDFYGTVVAINADRLTIRTAAGERDFMLVKSTLRGEPEFEKGAYVHVYYRQQTDGNVVTMIFRKLKDNSKRSSGAGDVSSNSSVTPSRKSSTAPDVTAVPSQ
jgi:ferric enterobactin receptor